MVLVNKSYKDTVNSIEFVGESAPVSVFHGRRVEISESRIIKPNFMRDFGNRFT